MGGNADDKSVDRMRRSRLAIRDDSSRTSCGAGRDCQRDSISRLAHEQLHVWRSNGGRWGVDSIRIRQQYSLYQSLYTSINMLRRSSSRGIIHVTFGIILKRTVEPRTIVRRKRDALPQPLDKVRVTGEVASVQKRVVPAVFQHAPRVALIPASGREEGSSSKDLAEAAQIDVGKPPAAEEVVLFLVAEDLLIALGTLAL